MNSNLLKVTVHLACFMMMKYWRPGYLLEKAVVNGRYKWTKLLLKAGINANTAFNGNMTPLHLASYYGHRDIVTLLVAQNADLNALNMYNMSALAMAVFSNRIDCVSTLLAAGAMTEHLSHMEGDKEIFYYNPPLEVACIFGYTEAAKLLVDAGANVNVEFADGRTLLDFSIDSPHNQNKKSIQRVLVDAGCILTEERLLLILYSYCPELLEYYGNNLKEVAADGATFEDYLRKSIRVYASTWREEGESSMWNDLGNVTERIRLSEKYGLYTFYRLVATFYSVLRTSADEATYISNANANSYRPFSIVRQLAIYERDVARYERSGNYKYYFKRAIVLAQDAHLEIYEDSVYGACRSLHVDLKNAILERATNRPVQQKIKNFARTFSLIVDLTGDKDTKDRAKDLFEKQAKILASQWGYYLISSTPKRKSSNKDIFKIIGQV